MHSLTNTLMMIGDDGISTDVLVHRCGAYLAAGYRVIALFEDEGKPSTVVGTGDGLWALDQFDFISDPKLRIERVDMSDPALTLASLVDGVKPSDVVMWMNPIQSLNYAKLRQLTTRFACRQTICFSPYSLNCDIPVFDRLQLSTECNIGVVESLTHHFNTFALYSDPTHQYYKTFSEVERSESSRWIQITPIAKAKTFVKSPLYPATYPARMLSWPHPIMDTLLSIHPDLNALKQPVAAVAP